MALTEAIALTSPSVVLSLPTTEVWLAIRADGDGIGDGSRENPFSVNTPTSFAAVMNRLGRNTLIHLGPGTFRTRGGFGNGYTFQNPADAWQPLDGQRIVGSGMFATVLRFEWDLAERPGDAPAQRHTMVSSANGDDVEVVPTAISCSKKS